jgi:hypothetical protein
MRVAGLRGCMRSKKRKTTRRDPRAAPAPDLLGRDFVGAQPNKFSGWRTSPTYRRRKASSTWPSSWMPTRASEAIVGWSMASHMKTENSWSTPSRWQYGGASHPQDSCIIPIAAPSTPRSRSASASKMSVSFLRWEGPGVPWTERHGGELRRHLEDRSPHASTSFPRSRGSKERHLGVSGRLLQPTQATFGFELSEPRRLRGGYNGRSGSGVDATRPRDRGNSTTAFSCMLGRT